MKIKKNSILDLLPLLLMLTFVSSAYLFYHPLSRQKVEIVIHTSIPEAPPEGQPNEVGLAEGSSTLPEEATHADNPKKMTRVVRATAYNADPRQTDDTPDICAWGDRVRAGIIAVSRDLEKMGLNRGQEVFVEGIGKFVVLDRMHRRKTNQIDIFMEKYEDAIRFGVQEVVISWNLAHTGERG